VGNDYALSPQVEIFHYFNKTYRLLSEMRKNPEPKMIGLLLEKCKEQEDAPAKQCLRWIHSLFVYFYRASNVPEEQTEQFSNLSSKTFLTRTRGACFAKA
jgi:hypothetical protein